ncbi:MAG: hypothetical protein WA740_17780, partial [Candidatus Binataceae bacterium]
MFKLTANAAVLDKPDRWGKKLSEVHAGFDVHVVGIALSYVQIRMKSGLEGFIPTSADAVGRRRFASADNRRRPLAGKNCGAARCCFFQAS